MRISISIILLFFSLTTWAQIQLPESVSDYLGKLYPHVKSYEYVTSVSSNSSIEFYEEGLLVRIRFNEGQGLLGIEKAISLQEIPEKIHQWLDDNLEEYDIIVAELEEYNNTKVYRIIYETETDVIEKKFNQLGILIKKEKDDL